MASTNIGALLRLRPEDGQPAWGGLVWALPMVYVFVAPFQRGASWVEWVVTSAVFTVFLALYAAGLIYWHRPRAIRLGCGIGAILAVCYTAYSPSGAIYLTLVAAFIPFGFSGKFAPSIVFVVLLAAVPCAEWLILGRELDTFVFVMSVNPLLIGAGTMFVSRQLLENERLHRLAERERISGDLHDILGHTLTVALLKAELAARLIGRDDARARQEVLDIERISRQALSDVRDAVRDSYAVDISTEIGRAKTVLESAGIVGEYEIEHVDMSPAQERALSLVLREAVTNTLRHACASRIRLTFGREGSHLKMSFRDNGRGTDSSEGFGMAGIRDRIESLGGRACWNGVDGTELTVTLPTSMQ